MVTHENDYESASGEAKPEVSEARKALVAEWCKRITKAEKYWDDKAFKRMRRCMRIAIDGAEKDWGEDNYVVPVLNRHINQAVARLYAKNPTAVYERKKRLMHTVWDGRSETAEQAAQEVMAATQAMMQGVIVEPNPQSIAILEDIAAVEAYETMVERLGQTLQILYAHYMEEQASGYKQQLKAAVRRTKVTGVSYVSLGFQRLMELSADQEQKISDDTAQIEKLQALAADVAAGKVDEVSPKLEELRLLMQQIQAQPELVVREGPVLSFPRSTKVIIDTRCYHLKTFAGAEWVAERMDMTPERIKQVFKKDVGSEYQKYTPDQSTPPELREEKSLARVYLVQNKTNGQTFAVCVGYCDFLREPGPPDVKLERFWTLFPLVFNEVETEDGDIFPPSDVWQGRHPQMEYNRARQGLREHRTSNRPKYFTSKGMLEEEDKKKLEDPPPFAVIELNALAGGQKIDDVIQAHKPVGIDPNQYEVNPQFEDILRSVGSQEAQFGVASGNTATETSIADNAQSVSSSDNVDDLDDMLTELARSMGELMLSELSVDTVKEIVGPGAVWPEMPPTREELVKELMLSAKAGSSGRPNAAAELAKLERAAPWVVQLPGVNPKPFAERFFTLLDLDLDNLIVEGLPSITAMNAMWSKGPPQPSAGDPQADPNQQGGEGGQNAPDPQSNEPQAQPAYPAGAPI